MSREIDYRRILKPKPARPWHKIPSPPLPEVPPPLHPSDQTAILANPYQLNPILLDAALLSDSIAKMDRLSLTDLDDMRARTAALLAEDVADHEAGHPQLPFYLTTPWECLSRMVLPRPLYTEVDTGAARMQRPEWEHEENMPRGPLNVPRGQLYLGEEVMRDRGFLADGCQLHIRHSSSLNRRLYNYTRGTTSFGLGHKHVRQYVHNVYSALPKLAEPLRTTAHWADTSFEHLQTELNSLLEDPATFAPGRTHLAGTGKQVQWHAHGGAALNNPLSARPLTGSCATDWVALKPPTLNRPAVPVALTKFKHPHMLTPAGLASVVPAAGGQPQRYDGWLYPPPDGDADDPRTPGYALYVDHDSAYGHRDGDGDGDGEGDGYVNGEGENGDAEARVVNHAANVALLQVWAQAHRLRVRWVVLTNGAESVLCHLAGPYELVLGDVVHRHAGRDGDAVTANMLWFATVTGLPHLPQEKEGGQLRWLGEDEVPLDLIDAFERELQVDLASVRRKEWAADEEQWDNEWQWAAAMFAARQQTLRALEGKREEEDMLLSSVELDPYRRELGNWPRRELYLKVRMEERKREAQKAAVRQERDDHSSQEQDREGQSGIDQTERDVGQDAVLEADMASTRSTRSTNRFASLRRRLHSLRR